MEKVQNRFVIWDLDNCLSDDAGRIGVIEWHRAGGKRWERYHTEAVLDMPNAFAMNIFKQQERDGVIPIIFTGRPEIHREETKVWIDEYIKPVNPVITVMRGKDDSRQSTELKLAMLRLCVKTGLFQISQVVAAYDDRQSIVDMYIANGIANAQVLRANNLCAYTDPRTGVAEGG